MLTDGFFYVVTEDRAVYTATGMKIDGQIVIIGLVNSTTIAVDPEKISGVYFDFDEMAQEQSSYRE